MTSPSPSNFPSQVWCVLKNKGATKTFLAFQKGAQIQSEYGWVYFIGNTSGGCRKQDNFTSAKYSTKMPLAECLLLYLQTGFICTTCAYCCCIVTSSFYEVISHILIVLTEGSLVVNMVTPCKYNMLCPFFVPEICNILHFKIHKESVYLVLRSAQYIIFHEFLPCCSDLL